MYPCHIVAVTNDAMPPKKSGHGVDERVYPDDENASVEQADGSLRFQESGGCLSLPVQADEDVDGPGHVYQSEYTSGSTANVA